MGVGAALIAQALDLDEQFVATIRDAAPLHDIGKVGISRRILLKPDKLTPSEWMHMMRHVEIGARILAPAKSPVLRMASEIAGTHHERWDGNGYVAGLVGAEIPLAGRITALADVWDTLTHERPYKPAWDEDRALAEINAQAGSLRPPHRRGLPHDRPASLRRARSPTGSRSASPEPDRARTGRPCGVADRYRTRRAQRRDSDAGERGGSAGPLGTTFARRAAD